MLLMADWIELFSSETAATIEGLTGQRPEISLKSKESAADASSVVAPIAIIEVSGSGELNGKAAAAIPPMIGTALSDMMLGGEGESKEDMDEGDMDAVKEIVSNIFGALSTTMKAQKDFPEISFKTEEIIFYKDGESVALSGYKTLLSFQFSLGIINGVFMILLDDELSKLVEDSSNDSKPTNEESSVSAEMQDIDIKNINLILDVKLPLKVRIGSKKMLLKDVLAMDIGSVVELDQLANDPLEVLVDDKVVAYGEVVIVDGNFGVQITHIGSKRETLEKLKG